MFVQLFKSGINLIKFVNIFVKFNFIKFVMVFFIFENGINLEVI